MMWGADALDAIRAEFEQPVAYRPGGSGPATYVLAVRLNGRAGAVLGGGANAQTQFQIALADWPFVPAPRRGDLLNDGSEWRVIDVDQRDDIAAHELTVESA